MRSDLEARGRVREKGMEEWREEEKKGGRKKRKGERLSVEQEPRNAGR